MKGFVFLAVFVAAAALLIMIASIAPAPTQGGEIVLPVTAIVAGPAPVVAKEATIWPFGPKTPPAPPACGPAVPVPAPCAPAAVAVCQPAFPILGAPFRCIANLHQRAVERRQARREARGARAVTQGGCNCGCGR